MPAFTPLTSFVSNLAGANGSIGVYDALVDVFRFMLLVSPVLCFVDAPHGKFGTWGAQGRWSTVDGRWGWMAMELVSPIIFLLSLLSSDLSPDSAELLSMPRLERLSELPWPSKIFVAAFLIHYLNRAVLSPLRSPARSRMHLLVVVSAVIYNLLNGYLLGAWLGGRAQIEGRMGVVTPEELSADAPAGWYARAMFWVGMALWALGAAGNIVHDEILMNLRRSGKKSHGNGDKTIANGGAGAEHTEQQAQPVYRIPHGLLFELVSYPNYLCEWLEWFGFALAASVCFLPVAPPVSASVTLSPPAKLPFFTIFSNLLNRSPSAPIPAAPLPTPPPPLRGVTLVKALSRFPPLLFFLTEVAFMMPRTVRGHWWYHEKFGVEGQGAEEKVKGEGKYPKKRRAVIPFLL